jgi:hypothetical protein
LASVAIGREAVVEGLRREHTRERMLEARLAWAPIGANFDLLAMIDERFPSLRDAPATAPILTQYESDLHSALLALDEHMLVRRERAALLRQARQRALDSGADVAAAIGHHVDEYFAVQRQVNKLWRLHDACAQRLEVLMPTEMRAAFADAVHEGLHAYLRPQSGPTPEQAFEIALGQSDLSPDQRKQLEDVRSLWRLQRDASRANLQRVYITTCDPDASRETYLMYLTAQAEALARQRASQQAWDTARDQWMQACKRTVDEIEVIASAAKPAEERGNP